MKDKLKDKKVKCRICNGEHFTARCPFKDTMAPVGEEPADVAAGPADTAEGPGGLGSGKSSYVPLIYEMAVLLLELVTEWAVASMSGMTWLPFV